MSRGILGGAVTLKAEDYKDLEQEAEVWKKLQHPNIVLLLEVGLEPYPWLVMEYIEGGSLRERLRQPHRIPLEAVFAIAIAVCKAVEYAHHAGVRCHQELKPENILLTNPCIPKGTDWGMARHSLSMSLGEGYHGTLNYSAPEQLDLARFGQIGHHTDVFTLGITLYERIQQPANASPGQRSALR
jgi:serine/threonine protein kinase